MASHQRFQRFTLRRQNNHRIGGQPGHRNFPSQLPPRHATAPSIRLLFCCRKAASLRLPSHLQAGRTRNFRSAVLVYFPAQNWGLRPCDQLVLITQTPPDERRGPTEGGGGRDELKSRLLFHDPADVDDVVGDDAETHPAVHSDAALVSAAVEAVSPFDDADASLASGAPFLAIAEPALSLLALAFRAFGRAIGNANALDPLRLCGQ